MEEKEYKYDVAFSLLNEDLTLAQEINDLLSDRYKTFLYSERQKEIAGADGEVKFKEVFSNQARFVVVFFREGWGKTPWTRMEEEAIRGRAYEEGYDFVKFIPLGDNLKVPTYLPKIQLWINATRFGAKGAASVIEARLAELGAVTSKESTAERAARLDRQIAFEEAKKRYLRDLVSVNDANKSFIEMVSQLEVAVNEIKSLPRLKELTLKTERNVLVMLGLSKSLRVEWEYHCANSLEDSELEVSIWKGHPPFPGVRHYRNPTRSKSIKMHFELCAGDVGMWVDNDKITYDARSLADYVLHFYLENGHS